jgi:hypothetical protein
MQKKHTSRLNFMAAGFWLPTLLFVLSGCQTPPNNPPPQATVKAPDLPAPATSAAPPSALSYGMVTGRVQKGVTTQQNIIDLFGGPSTMTTDKDGVEVWMYDKTSSTVSGSYAQSGAQASHDEANTMAAFLGIPLVAGVAGTSASANSQSAQVSQGTENVTSSVKTITFIIKFNPDKTVKDYAVRQASY